MSETNIVGNTYDKYNTVNPVARYLMSGFLSSVSDMFNQCKPDSVLEVGCGEGRLIQHLLQNSPVNPKQIVATDLSLAKIENKLDQLISFEEASIYELPYEDDKYDMVVCCEVLEHLDEPAAGLRELARVSKNNVIISTPREPLWRLLNLLRGKYIKRLGNTPGHVQNFSRHELIKLTEKHFKIISTRNPIPWTIILASPL